MLTGYFILILVLGGFKKYTLAFKNGKENIAV
jgi:hypothetical protein